MAVKVLGLTEVCQVLMISEDLNREGRAMEIVSPRLQDADDCKKLPIVDIIISFSWDECFGEVQTQMPVTAGVHLEKDGVRSIF